MAAAASWYNAERVAQPGSVILTTWRAQREAARAVQAPAHHPAARRTTVARRSYSGAAVGDLTASFTGDLVSINRELEMQLPLLVGRSRQLAKNDPYVRKFLRMAQNHIVGPVGFGLSVPCKRPDGKIDTFDKSIVEAAFVRWSKRGVCDTTGRLAFRRLCRLLVLCWARDGEFIVRRVRDSNLNAFGYALQVIDPILLDYSYRADFPDGRKIRMGVEINAYGRPIAYHFCTDVEMAPFAGGRRVRVPAEEIWHGFLQDEPDQVRGVPWVHASMRRLNDLGGYVEAAVIAARVGASKMGFYIPPATELRGSGVLEEGLAEDDDGDDLVTESTPGSYEKLPPGYDFKTFDPDYPHQNFDAFLKAALRGVSAGLPGSDYNTLANDLEGVNYSSMRSGSLESRDDWKGLQGEFVDMFLEPLSPEWLAMGFVSGQLDPLPVSKFAKYDCFAWQGRRWTWVDPKNDVETRILEIDKGLNSFSSTMREQGLDPEAVWTELENDLDRMASLAEKRRALSPVQPPAAPAQPAGAAVSGASNAGSK